MRALILTEGGLKVGFGHVTRCQALYQAFRERKIECRMVVNGDDTLRDILGRVPHTRWDWTRPGGGKKLSALLKDYPCIIVDSYLASREVYGQIGREARLAVYLDDYKRMRYPRGWVLNGSVYAGELTYPRAQGTRLLRGPSFVSLRKAFWDVPSRRVRKRAGKILISFGGTDGKNLTVRVAEMLQRQLPDLRRVIVVGRGFRHSRHMPRLRQLADRLVGDATAGQMKDIMLDCDLAVSSGGQTLYELARTGLPAVAVCVAENQRLNTASSRWQGFIRLAGNADDKDVLERVVRNVEDMRDFRSRSMMSRRGRRAVDGQGARRVVARILKSLHGKMTA